MRCTSALLQSKGRQIPNQKVGRLAAIGAIRRGAVARIECRTTIFGILTTASGYNLVLAKIVLNQRQRLTGQFRPH